MKKKYYIILLFTGTLFIFSFLPLLNYLSDPWRVLHQDYDNSYKGISANKSYLKVAYLLENKNKYDTLFMGSSRSGYLDAGLVSSHAYNMKYNFGVAGMHLHNLKVLLENKVAIKSLWLGINDYSIWKNPKDHESDYQRKTYKNNILDTIDFYSFYFLRELNHRDLRIFNQKIELLKSYEITNPDKINLKTARKREKIILDDPDFWIKKMTNLRLTLLGYDDKEYRIDDTVNELKEIKKLCDEHHIKLTPFIYPAFYKTYLHYNQNKIEEFKRKLVSVVDFYDFYGLNHIALNELNWMDSSHFTLSVGNYIIQNIQRNNFLVTKDNIDTRIIKTRELMISFLHKSLDDIYKFNINIDIGSLKTIFNLKDKQYEYYKNNQFDLDYNNSFIRLHVNNIDPTLILNQTKAKSKNVVLTYKIESPKDTVLQVFYKKNSKSEYNEKDSHKVYIKKGLFQFNLVIPSTYLNNELRIDLANSTGTYIIKEFSIGEAE